MSLARYAAVSTRSWAADSGNARVRLRAQLHRLEEEVALLRAEMRIKDARMSVLAPHRRPHYPPAERLEILELKAARGWSLQQTAEAFLVTAATIASWMTRLDEEGPDALVRLRTPVNRFPEFVRYAVARLKTLCPTLGKKKLAETLARAGLHLGATTVGRMRRERPPAPPFRRAEEREPESDDRIVTAKRPNHVWHVDLTVVPTQAGFWCSWIPFSFPQCWPFCWWVAVVMDHCSRRVVGIGLFRSEPTSIDVRSVLGRAIRAAGAAPKHLVSDKGTQFWPSRGYRRWCQRRGIRPRFGAIGQHGSIAVVERFIRSLKWEGLHRMFVPYSRDAMRRELEYHMTWHNEHRPHTTLRGRTPDEVYFRRFPANRRPRIESRPGWPRGSPCASPQVLIAGRAGAEFTLEVSHVGGRMHLPIVTLRRAA
jgi:putative transposase